MDKDLEQQATPTQAETIFELDILSSFSVNIGRNLPTKIEQPPKSIDNKGDTEKVN